MNINDPAERRGWHDALADALCEQLSSDRFITAFVRAGGENSPLANYLAEMRQCGGPMATRIRRDPDGKLIVERRLAHWDVKAARTIEKDAWLHYDELIRRGEPVLLFQAPQLLDDPPTPNRVFAYLFNDLVLKHGNMTVLEITDPARRYPVDAKGWILPRQHPGGAQRGSGTPYREIWLTKIVPKLPLGNACRRPHGTVELTRDMFAADTLKRILRSATHSYAQPGHRDEPQEPRQL